MVAPHTTYHEKRGKCWRTFWDLGSSVFVCCALGHLGFTPKVASFKRRAELERV